jgi:hypothetical protein
MVIQLGYSWIQTVKSRRSTRHYTAPRLCTSPHHYIRLVRNSDTGMDLDPDPNHSEAFSCIKIWTGCLGPDPDLDPDPGLVK